MNKIKRAIVSVYNKKNLKKLLICLKKFNIEIISSGGTFREIKKLGFSCIEVSRYTNNFEINFYVDTNNIYIDDINFNQLQQLLREDEAYYQLVTRIK